MKEKVFEKRQNGVLLLCENGLLKGIKTNDDKAVENCGQVDIKYSPLKQA